MLSIGSMTSVKPDSEQPTATPQGSPDNDELENLFLLRGVELESIHGLLDRCPVFEKKPGQILLERGQRNRYLYVLLSGRVRVQLELTADPIAILGPGEIVGELSLIDGQPTSAYVITHEKCRLLVIEEKIMWSLVYGCPAVARNLLSVLAHRLRHGNSVIGTHEEVQHEFESAAFVDVLTGRYNRRWLAANLPPYMERCRKEGFGLCLLVCSIDRFKEYRQTYGREAGDQALYTVARLLRSTCSRVGTWITRGEVEVMRPGEVTVRYGEDQFAAVLPDRDGRDSLELAEGLRVAVGEASVATLTAESLPSLTLSAGVAQMTSEDNPQSFLAAADAVLGQAREDGGNQVRGVNDSL